MPNLTANLEVSLLLEIGSVLRQRYKIRAALSKGGMGAVYLAEDLHLVGSLCAIKQMLDLGADLNEYVKARFTAEMEVLTRLRHASIPNVRDFFQEGQGWFLVMDYIQGNTLEEELAAHRQAGTCFSNRAAVQDMLEVLDVLAYLHGQNPQLLHRDIKPANLIRDSSSGKVVVVDFGLARSLEESASAVHTSVGTLGYSAHEQLTGKPEVASDLYSVGATLHEMISGLRPTLAGVEALTRQNMPEYDPVLASLLARACDHEVKKRFRSAQEMSQSLRAVHGIQGERLPPPSGPPARSRKFSSLLALALLAGGLLFALYRPPASKSMKAPDPGIQGDLFVGRQDGRRGVVGLGEDVGLLWIEEADADASRKRSQVVARRLNYLYHHQCMQCGLWLLEPDGLRVGRYQQGKTDEIVVFYAHMHDQQFVYGPELLVTVDSSLARELQATPRFAAGYWRDLLRDVISVSRGEPSARTSLGPAFASLLAEDRQKEPPASLERLRRTVASLSSKQATLLRESFRHVPEDLRFEADRFPEHSGFKPLTN